MNPFSLTHEGEKGVDKDRCGGEQREIEGIYAWSLLVSL